MKTTFASFAFGCRVNQAEKIHINRKLIEKGFKYSQNHPDLYIINSCAVTQKAEREVRQYIYQIRKKYPLTKIIVTGCAATFWRKNSDLIKDVDLLIPNNEKDLIPVKLITLSLSLRGEVKDDNKTIFINSVILNESEGSSQKKILRSTQNDKDTFPDKFLESGRLIIKIQDGCQRYCSYCLVPYLRGKPESKTIKEILTEINQYKNIQEVILSAINTEYFGKNNETLTQLINEIINKTKIPRISLGSLHPWSLTNEFIQFYKQILPLNRLVNFFHIPLQSGSDKILKLMNRKYTSHQFIDKLERIKQINPDAFISTDIIVGFPGETHEEFNKTYNFLENAPIDKFHIFRFSMRKGTTAEILIKHYAEPTNVEKKIRSEKLRKLSQQKFIKFNKSQIGRFDQAIVINKNKVLLSNNLPARVSNLKSLKKRIINIKIQKFYENLIGAGDGTQLEPLSTLAVREFAPSNNS